MACWGQNSTTSYTGENGSTTKASVTNALNNSNQEKIMKTSSNQLHRNLANRRACKRIRNQTEGPSFQDLPTQPIMVNKRMIDLACDNFFRSRGMPQKGPLSIRTSGSGIFDKG
jgi:hypothetical protein